MSETNSDTMPLAPVNSTSQAPLTAQGATSGTPAAPAPAPAATEPVASAQKLEGLVEANSNKLEYTDFKVPQGFDALDAESLAAATPLFKEAGLSQEQAQKFVDLQAKFVSQMRDKQMQQFTATKTEWLSTAKSDKEFGGDKFDESAGHAKMAIDKLGTPELKTLLDDYGIGNHPEMIRFAWKIGKLLSEDRGVGTSSKPAASTKDLAERLYG